MPNDQNPPRQPDASESDLKQASATLKAKIAAAKARSDLPLDSTLGNPNWDKDAADGHLDLPDDDDEGWPAPAEKAKKPSPP